MNNGFTLLELLIVLGLTALLTGLLIPAFVHAGSASRLGAAGNQVANLLRLARQNSTAKQVMSALIVLTDPTLSDRNRLLTIFECRSATIGSSAWRQITGWEMLPPGVVADPISDARHDYTFTFEDSANQPPTAFPPVRYGNHVVSVYKYALFLPNGNLLDSNAEVIRLSEGYFPPGLDTPIYTRGEKGMPENFYDITILPATGRLIISRP